MENKKCSSCGTIMDGCFVVDCGNDCSICIAESSVMCCDNEYVKSDIDSALSSFRKLVGINNANIDMYRALRGLFELLSFDDKYMHLDEVKAAEAALAKAEGEMK